MATITARVDDSLREKIEDFWREHGIGPSSGLKRMAEEWWAMQTYPAIEFADGPAGRRARLRRGPDVWEVVMVARDHGDDRRGLREHFASVAAADLDQALAYAAEFPGDVEQMLRENERIAAFLARTPD
ncbi:hypothetical protein BH23GEM2_BH23GEM2_20300 [soil metagenome]